MPVVRLAIVTLAVGVASESAWPNSGEHEAVTPIRDYVDPGTWRYDQLQLMVSVFRHGGGGERGARRTLDTDTNDVATAFSLSCRVSPSIQPGTGYQPYTAVSACVWGIEAGVSHRMSLRLRNAMESLSRNVFQAMNGTTYNIRVIAGYQNATAAQRAAGDTALFFEGRALIIRLYEESAPVSANATLTEFFFQVRG